MALYGQDEGKSGQLYIYQLKQQIGNPGVTKTAEIGVQTSKGNMSYGKLIDLTASEIKKQ